MNFRKAAQGDLDRVMEIKEQVVPIMRQSGNMQWSEAYPNMERFSLDVENGSLFVYEIDGTIAGFVVIDDEHPSPYDDMPWELTKMNTAAMHRMAVDPDFQGQGIAKKMMAEAESMLKEKGYLGIHTDTSVENKRMQQQFEKNGYEFKGQLNLDDNLDDWYAAYEKVF